ncbi:MAG: KEOPS complex subunit Cgi121 [Candidatus Korarchaeota archaeon]
MRLEIAGRKVLITAYEKGNIDYTQNACIMDASKIAGMHHLLSATAYALTRETSVARTTALEIMIIASAQREISKAIKIFDPKNAKVKALVVVGDSWDEIEAYLSRNSIIPSDELLSCGDKVKEAFNLTDVESASPDEVLKAVLTRMAFFITTED